MTKVFFLTEDTICDSITVNRGGNFVLKNNQITKDTREQIAMYVVQFLRKRFVINQDLIADRPEKIDFDVFMNLYDRYGEAIEVEEQKEENRTLKNEEGEELLSFANALRMCQEILVNSRSASIVLSHEQIEEILEFVRESILTCGLGTTAMCVPERDFLHLTLKRLSDKLEIESKDSEKYDKVARYARYANLSENVAFSNKISGRISVGYGSIISIVNHENRPVCNFSVGGANIVPVSVLNYEKIYLLKDLYFGRLKDENGQDDVNDAILIRRRFDEYDFYEALMYPYRIFNADDQRILNISPLREYCEKYALDHLLEQVYTEREFRDMCQAYDNSVKLGDEEREKLNKVAQIAADWWMKAGTVLKFDNGDDSELGRLTRNAQIHLSLNKIPPNDDALRAFNNALVKKIKKALLSQPYISIARLALKVDYHPCGLLSEAAEEVNLIVNFPWKMTMNISLDNVNVAYGSSSEVQVLYSSKEEDFGDSSMGTMGGRKI